MGGGEQQGLRRFLVDGDSRERSRELENRLGRLWDLDRFSDEEGYRDRSRHNHMRYTNIRIFQRLCTLHGSYSFKHYCDADKVSPLRLILK